MSRLACTVRARWLAAVVLTGGWLTCAGFAWGQTPQGYLQNPQYVRNQPVVPNQTAYPQNPSAYPQNPSAYPQYPPAYVQNPIYAQNPAYAQNQAYAQNPVYTQAGPVAPNPVYAQNVEAMPAGPTSSEARSRERSLIGDVREPELTLDVEPRTSKIIRTKRPVIRFSITHPQILEVVQFNPTEFELIGALPGETSMTLWFSPPDGNSEGEMLRYLVRVSSNDMTEDRLRIEYTALERKVNELFPNSMVRLFPVAEKLIVRGQARDSREAGDIMQLIGGEVGDYAGYGNNGWGNGRGGWGGYGGYGGWGGYGYAGYGWGGWGGYGAGGRGGWGNVIGPRGANDYGRGAYGSSPNIINMLEVPGEKQVMLKVRVAELSRAALRDAGTTLNLNFGDFTFNSSLGLNGVVSAVLSTEDLQLTMEALNTNSYSKVLAEPNLVTLSGHSAYFVAGGEFAVPTVVGVEGVSAISTSFRSFGTVVRFTPTVVDKDRIRLEVSPSLSSTDEDNEVQGIPGLKTRAVTTTVDLREGQWLAIAGLIQDQQEGSKIRVPFIGDIPVLDTLFSKRHVKRDETELMILVSPELVHPLEPEEAPLILPGMEVTEPTDCAFYFGGYYEGKPDCNYRSTVFNLIQRENWEARQNAKTQPGYQRAEGRYIQGPHGFSQ